jgi:hypothetical protein
MSRTIDELSPTFMLATEDTPCHPCQRRSYWCWRPLRHCFRVEFGYMPNSCSSGRFLPPACARSRPHAPGAPGATIVLGADDTVERRSGRKIKAEGCYRDAVRSTHKHVIRCFGLKWVSMMLLVSVLWIGCGR